MLEGHFTRHIRRMCMLYAMRRATIVTVAKHELGEMLEINSSEAGMQLVGWLHPNKSLLYCLSKLVRKLFIKPDTILSIDIQNLLNPSLSHELDQVIDRIIQRPGQC